MFTKPSGMMALCGDGHSTLGWLGGSVLIASASLVVAAGVAALPAHAASVGRPPGKLSGQPGQVTAVEAVSSTDVWTVTNREPDGQNHAVLQHWDGQSWSNHPLPQRFGAVILNDVVVAGTDVWVAGSVEFQVPSIERWDGRKWSTFALPDPEGAITSLAVVSEDDIWAVGDRSGNSCFIEHWDGTSWTHVNQPSQAGLSGVSANGPDDVWAVGSTIGQHKTLAEHWDGTAWKIVNALDPDRQFNQFNAVSVLPTGGAITVGQYGGSHDAASSDSSRVSRTTQALAEVWHAGTWALQATPSLGKVSVLSAISAVSSNDVWSDGYYMPIGFQGLVEHWDGTAWQHVNIPERDIESQLLDISADSSSDVWAVGYTSPSGGMYRTWVLHWDGSNWNRV